VITSYPYKNLVEDAKKKKPVNRKGFQRRSWELQKNKPHMEDMTKD
jgi:hypothetical protein